MTTVLSNVSMGVNKYVKVNGVLTRNRDHPDHTRRRSTIAEPLKALTAVCTYEDARLDVVQVAEETASTIATMQVSRAFPAAFDGWSDSLHSAFGALAQLRQLPNRRRPTCRASGTGVSLSLTG